MRKISKDITLTMEMMKMKISAIEFSLAGDKYLGRSYEEMDEIRWTGRMRNSWKAGHKNTRTQKTLRMGFASVGMTRKFRVKSGE